MIATSSNALADRSADGHNRPMLSLDECIGMSGLTEDEVTIIAEQQHLHLIVACELGATLLKTPKGIFKLRGYLLDALELATAQGRTDKAKRIDAILTRFNIVHPLPRVL
jgi:hypothetical protein